MPPLLTIVLFLWAWNTIESYVLRPLESGARAIAVFYTWDVHEAVPPNVTTTEQAGRVTGFLYAGEHFVRVGEQFIPAGIYEAVNDYPGPTPPSTARGYYDRYVSIRWLRRSLVVPIFLCVFTLVLYLLGKFLAAGVGRIFFNFFEGIIDRLPIIRNVYSSVKQVTDFIFSEREIAYNRVVAVEYPRRGMWSVGFVTGESMSDIRSAANEPVLTVLMPTSPMPATGFTITVRRSETIDLDITIDQAIQFVVSCGVVVPRHQLHIGDEIASQVSAAISGGGNGSSQPGNLSDSQSEVSN